jgi:alpha-mannosidase
MKEDEKNTRLTRRDFLGGSATLLAGTMMSRIVKGFDRSSILAQLTPKRIYIAPDDHTDYFWAAGEAEYQQAFVEMLDYYLDLADATASEPSEHQSRWNCDGSFWMWTYEKNKSAADFQRLINHIRSGHISVPLNVLCVCLGGAPTEAVLRGMYYSGQIERRYNVRFSLAYGIENVAQPYGLVSLWTGSGAKYSWKGVCGCDTQLAYTTLSNRDDEIYWWVGPDGSRMLVKWYSLSDSQSLGGYAEARYPSAVVDSLDSKCYSPGYNYGISGAFGYGWDDLKVFTNDFVTVAKAKTNGQRQVIVSNEKDFFEDFEATYGAGLPSVSASFGNEWDLYCTALAEVSARVKRAVEKLRAAEALATLVSLQDPSFTNGRQAARDQAWMNLGLFWEHNFGMAGYYPTKPEVAQRTAWQRRLATEIEAYVDSIHTDAANALGGMIQKSGSNLRFYAFNPLSWMRTDIADLPYSGSSSVHVIDLSTNQQVPLQIVTVDGQRRLRILAKDVPPVGYKIFEIQSGAGQSFSGGPSANASTGLIQNSLYEISVAPRGAIISLKDKSRGNREFAKNINGYYVNDLGPSSGTLAVENTGPVSATLRASASSPLTHATRITLFRAPLNRIDIRNDINQNFDGTYTWRFGFNLTSPDVWHEEVGAIIRAKLLAAGGHYAPRNARYDWLTLNHFAAMSGAGGVGITLSNADCYFMKLGISTPSSLDTNTPQISPLVGGQVGGGGQWGLPDQGGDTHFLQRFALQSYGAFSFVGAMKFALEHQNPLVTGVVPGGNAYPEKSYSFLTISNPNVLLWALKPADDGIVQGIIARVWNLSASPASFSLSASIPISGAKHTTHIETPLEDATVANGTLADSLKAEELKTFSLKAAEASGFLEKSASPRAGSKGTTIRYTLSFVGTGNTLNLTDTLPAGVSAPDNFELAGTSVSPAYNSGEHRLTWSDTPPEGQVVTIRYRAVITTSNTQTLVNHAALTELGGVPGTAQSTVIANPELAYLPLVLKQN